MSPEYKARNHGEEIDALLSERDSMTPRPDDEMDLTQNNKAFGLLHHETKRAFEEWPHGVLYYDMRGKWIKAHLGGFPNHTYRAQPAPVHGPNLIERVRNKPLTTAREYALWFALREAAALIDTMSGGDADKRAAYEEAIK